MKVEIAEGVTENTKARAINKKIRPQFAASPEGNLMFAILERAILDLAKVETKKTLSKREEDMRFLERRQAASFLKGEITCAGLCGVDPDWVRKVIKDGGLSLNIERIEG